MRTNTHGRLAITVAVLVACVCAHAQVLTDIKMSVLDDAVSGSLSTSYTNMTSVFVGQIMQMDTATESQKSSITAWYGNKPKADLIELSPALASSDFTREAKSILVGAFWKERTKENLLLAALAAPDEVHAYVEDACAGDLVEPPSGRFYGSLTWAAYMVKARYGDEASVGKLLERARGADVQTQVAILLKDLAYVTQHDVVNYIKEFVLSDARLISPKPSAPGLLHAQYALAALSRMLYGFPVIYKEDYSYTEAEIAAAREWLTTQTEFLLANGNKNRRGDK